MSGTSRFDCYPSDFLNGVIGMTADEIAAYAIVLMLQYDRGEAVKYEGRERELAIRAGMSQGRLGKAIERLVALDKLAIADGSVFNRRAERELEKIRERIVKNRENSAKGGKSTREKFIKKDNENNESEEPHGRPNGGPKDSPIPSSFVPRPPVEEEKIKPRASSLDAKFDDEFENSFWPEWCSRTGHKVNRKDAKKRFAALRRKGSDLETIVSGVARYVSAKPSWQAWKSPDAWLNGEKFLDAPAPEPQARAGPASPRKRLSMTERMALGITSDAEETAFYESFENRTGTPDDSPYAASYDGPTLDLDAACNGEPGPVDEAFRPQKSDRRNQPYEEADLWGQSPTRGGPR
jgi:hypothetical protein